MADESSSEKLSRLQMMASGHETWDLSQNDMAAIRFALSTIRDARQLIAWAAPMVAEHTALVGKENLSDVMVRFLEMSK